MKLFFITLLAVIGLHSNISAQKTTAKAVISTPKVQCDMCKDRIEKVMIREYGVTSVKVDIKKRVTTQ